MLSSMVIENCLINDQNCLIKEKTMHIYQPKLGKNFVTNIKDYFPSVYGK